ncbi:MAG: PAS domain S-box protein [Anaerolineae bacterium]|nr:PAS domain S-box protein [Anaerolineae bacterium]
MNQSAPEASSAGEQLPGARPREGAAFPLDGLPAEALLQLQTAALRAAANGVIITGASGHILWSNPAFTTMTGYSSEEVIGRTPSFLKSNRQAPDVYREMWETILAGQVWSGEVINRRKDGSLYVEEQTITPVVGGDGQPTHFIAIKHDITTRRAAEDELRRRNQELTILNRVGSALNNSLALADALATCRGLLAAVPDAAGGAVYLLDETGGLSLATAWGEREAERFEGQGDSALRDCLERANAAQIVLVEGDVLCIPLLAQGRVQGVLALRVAAEGHGDGGAPALGIPFYEALGRELGTAIQNALLFNEVKAARERAQALARRLVDAQEAERRHIALELHDEAAQVLMGMKLGLSVLEREAASAGGVILQVGELRKMADAVLDTLRNLAMDLRPASLDHLGLAEAIRQYAETIAEKHGLAVDFEATGAGERLPANVENALYRIAQEALANVVRHARASRVDILLEQGKRRVLLMIEDDGIGMRPAEGMQGANGHLGLIGIRERVEMLGGTMRIESEPGAGTTLVVEAPSGRAPNGRAPSGRGTPNIGAEEAS